MDFCIMYVKPAVMGPAGAGATLAGRGNEIVEETAVYSRLKDPGVHLRGERIGWMLL